MTKFIKSTAIIVSIVLATGYLTSCVDFFKPDQGINITEDELYTDWYEYRAASMGLYALQQELVEQIVVLGELRGDLLTVTDNADADLMEIYNFNITKDNKYASPDNFFKLIAASNRFLNILEQKKPSVTDPSTQVDNYDRLYGEALCMRAWAYFNAVRIYGEVPFIDQRLSTIEEINEFINSETRYVDSVYVIYGLDGYTNETIINKEVVLEKNYFDTDRVIRHFTQELETKVKAVGVNHYIENNDNSWEVTVWNPFAYNALMGEMYLTLGDLSAAERHFTEIVGRTTDNNRYQLDDAFAYDQWYQIFTNIDGREHILTLEFDKRNQQQNDFQRLFEPFRENGYMLKPTTASVHYFETEWVGSVIAYNDDKTETINPGQPSDWYRGFGTSYLYVHEDGTIPNYYLMLYSKMQEEERTVNNIMEGCDTLVYKYSLNKATFDQDVNFILYRAGDINLYLAEIYTYRQFYNDSTGKVSSNYQYALNILNDGSYYDAGVGRDQLGVRGRVGLPGFSMANKVYNFDPFTNEFIDWYDLGGNMLAKQLKLEEDIMEERARELAYEGKRFYDLMRVAKRRNDPAFLAEKVADKYPASMKTTIYNHLMNEQNWYINYFE